MEGLFAARADRLTIAPRMGRPGALDGTRELVVHPNYRLVYTVDEDTVTIVALVHSAQHWPPADD